MSNLIRDAFSFVFMGLATSSYAPEINPSETEQTQIKILKSLENSDNVKTYCDRSEFKRIAGNQRTIDSLAYKNLFDGTALANDSAVLNEFNKISQYTAPHPRHAIDTNIHQDFDDILKSNGCSQKEVYAIRSKTMKAYPMRDCGEIHFTNEGNFRCLAWHQYMTDSVIYTKFFKENGILSKDVQKKISQIARVIKP